MQKSSVCRKATAGRINRRDSLLRENFSECMKLLRQSQMVRGKNRVDSNGWNTPEDFQSGQKMVVSPRYRHDDSLSRRCREIPAGAYKLNVFDELRDIAAGSTLGIQWTVILVDHQRRNISHKPIIASRVRLGIQREVIDVNSDRYTHFVDEMQRRPQSRWTSLIMSAFSA